jgi:hypothetical protein
MGPACAELAPGRKNTPKVITRKKTKNHVLTFMILPLSKEFLND